MAEAAKESGCSVGDDTGNRTLENPPDPVSGNEESTLTDRTGLPTETKCAVLRRKSEVEQDLGVERNLGEERNFEVVVEKMSIPPLGDKDLLIAVQFVGICGADVHLWWRGKYASHGLQIGKGRTIMGHEASGKVIATGREVAQKFQEGDRVVIEPARPCLECANCKNGKSNICLTSEPWKQPLYGGFLTEYIVVPAVYVHKLPDCIGTDEAALIEQFSFALCACEKSKIKPSQKLLILGAGPLGLKCLMASKAKGVHDIIVTDLKEYRINKAKDLGAKDGLKTENLLTNMDDVLDKIMKLFDGGLPDVVFECSAARSCQQLAINVAKPGGSCVFLGEDEQDIKFSLGKWASKDLHLHAVGTVDRRFFREAIEFAADSRDVQFRPLISQTHIYSLNTANDALEAASSREDGVLKVLVRCTDA